jgi:hypothetical protein
MSIWGSRVSDPLQAGSADPAADRRAATNSAGSAGARLSTVFLAVVIVFLVVPLLQTLHPFIRTVRPVDERRASYPPPSPWLLLQATGDFAAGLNKWFDDRVGFRDLFIRTKNQIDYSIFATSRKVYVGSNGWLFDRDNPGLVVERLDAGGLAALEGSFLALARRLHERGVRLVVIGYPDKARIYPEMLPAEAPLPPRGGNADKLRQFLSRQPALTFIDAEEIFRRESSTSTDRLYFKTDLHATEPAQLPVVREIIAQIARSENRSDISWDEKFERAVRKWGPGSDGRSLALLVPVHEDAPYFKGTYTIGGDEPDGHWNIPDRRVFDSADDGVGRPFDWEFLSRPELCKQRLPGMVIFGNSFSDFYWALGLHRYFCFIRRARDPISRFPLFFDTIPEATKYFIFEYYLPWVTVHAPPSN